MDSFGHILLLTRAAALQVPRNSGWVRDGQNEFIALLTPYPEFSGPQGESVHSSKKNRLVEYCPSQLQLLLTK